MAIALRHVTRHPDRQGGYYDSEGWYYPPPGHVWAFGGFLVPGCRDLYKTHIPVYVYIMYVHIICTSTYRTAILVPVGMGLQYPA